jgi:hypothetical protein
LVQSEATDRQKERKNKLAAEGVITQDMQHIRDKSSVVIYTAGWTRGIRAAIEERNWTEDQTKI